MNKFFFFCFFCLLIVTFPSCNSKSIQKSTVNESGNSVRLMFYNTENLFDTVDDPEKKDEEFTPQGAKHWTYNHYQTKLNHIAQVVTAVGAWEAPAIVGLCEVENRQVLEDLITKTGLSSVGYKIVHKESPDERGIDVGLLYRDKFIEPLNYRAIPVKLEGRPTRDILYFKSLVKHCDTLHFFVNHWPSRYGGQKKSDPNRILAAQTLKHTVDSILTLNPKANIVITGDFNDDPQDRSLREGLGAYPPDVDGNFKLFNLSAQFGQNGTRGSLKYRGNWNVFDQFIVSSNLITAESCLRTKPNQVHIFYGLPENEFLLETDDRYQGLQPFRTYWGRTYHGGYSDHLPVYIDLTRSN